MVKCMACGVEFKRITKMHLDKHKLSFSEYETLYPGSPLICEETRKRYSEGTKRHYSSLDDEQKKKKYANRQYSAESIKTVLATLEKGRNSIDYTSKKRNQAISIAKKRWWADKSVEERSTFVREKIIPAVRANLGEEVYRAQLREKGIKGYQTLLKKGKTKELNLFEQEMVDLILSKGYECITQFEISKWFFDCYIPEKNLLIEFDGDYWHPKSLEDCTNKRLKRQWVIDRKKEELAKQQGYDLIRIRQSEKHLLFNVI